MTPLSLESGRNILLKGVAPSSVCSLDLGQFSFQGVGMKRFLVAIFLSFYIVSASYAQSPCQASQMFALSVAGEVAQTCAPLGKKKRARTIKKAFKGLKGIRSLLGTAGYRSVRAGLKTVSRHGCQLDALSATLANQSLCSPELATMGSLLLENVVRSACTKRYQVDRENQLKRYQKRVNQARNILGSALTRSTQKAIRTLLRSKSCGQGGEERTLPCNSIRDAKDGYLTGNVYKLSDHSPHYPVFVTHDGARSCRAVAPNGQVLDSLRYTGLANPDPQGLRHHYRFNRSCTSFPASFYIECAGRCYEIGSRCSRVD